MQASLVMRDRETDSWWSIMTSDAIGGDLDGEDLRELPVGEKSTWRAWRERYPETRVLSIDGREHIAENPYDHYFSSAGTFRDLVVEDDRLAPKTSIFSFWSGGKPIAVAHSTFVGGKVLELPGSDDRILLHRPADVPIFASTSAYRLTGEATQRGADDLLATLDAGAVAGVEVLPGFDTFWYNWVAVNADSLLLE